MKKLKILAVFSIVLLFAACASNKGGNSKGRSYSATNGGGTKGTLVDLTGAFIRDPKHPWTQEGLKVKQYYLEGNIVLSWVDVVSDQWTDESGVTHISDSKTPKTHVIKSGTELTLDTIVGATFWFRYDDNGLFRWISFMRYNDDRFYFTPGSMTVNLDGVQCTYQPTSLSARIKLNIVKSDVTNKIEKTVAEGSRIGGGSGGNSDGSNSPNGGDSRGAPAGYGNDPFSVPTGPANNQQQNQRQQTQPAQQQSKPAPSGKQPLLPDGM